MRSWKNCAREESSLAGSASLGGVAAALGGGGVDNRGAMRATRCAYAVAVLCAWNFSNATKSSASSLVLQRHPEQLFSLASGISDGMVFVSVRGLQAGRNYECLVVLNERTSTNSDKFSELFSLPPNETEHMVRVNLPLVKTQKGPILLKVAIYDKSPGLDEEQSWLARFTRLLTPPFSDSTDRDGKTERATGVPQPNRNITSLHPSLWSGEQSAAPNSAARKAEQPLSLDGEQEACTQAGDVRARGHTHTRAHTNASHTPDPKEASSSKNEDGLGIELEPIGGIEVEELARISTRLARKYSATQCLGPAATSAIESRRKHPREDVTQEFLLAGEEGDYSGGYRQRVCHIKNACLKSYDSGVPLYVCVCILLHMLPLYMCPHNPIYVCRARRAGVHIFLDNERDVGGNLLKTEFDETIAARFVSFSTHCDGVERGLPAEKFRVFYDTLPDDVNVVWCSLCRHY